jgi:hypothetical protein
MFCSQFANRTSGIGSNEHRDIAVSLVVCCVRSWGHFEPTVRNSAIWLAVRRGLALALKRSSVRAYMRDEILGTLGLTAMRAARRMDELLTSSSDR